MEMIDERIAVGAVFQDNVVKPRWFIWNNRKYEVKEITFRWKNRVGADVFSYFSVSDGNNLYQLSLSQKHLLWTLEKVA